MRAWIHLCLEQRWVVVGLAIVLVILGAHVSARASFDAFPEFALPRVEIQTEAPGLSSEEVEALITTPLEAALAGTPSLVQMRSRSVLGLSSVVLLFAPDSDRMEARTLVQERVARVAPGLPANARAPVLLAPLSSTSRMLKIAMWSSERSPMELTDLARWIVRPHLMAIPGVANVAIWGERSRQLQVRVDPERLAAHAITLDRVVTTTTQAVAPRAGGFVDGPTQRFAVTHVPLARTAEQLAAVPLAPVLPISSGAPTLGDVAEVVEDHPALIGDAVVTGGAGLLLIVEKQPAGNTLEITQRVDAALAALASAMPGVEIDATIFRPASFIERALDNLAEAMGIGCTLVILVIVVFLWDIRTALVSVTAIPLSLLTAAVVLTSLGRTIDTMVLAGLVIALGEVVDDAIIDVENIHRRWQLELANGGAPSLRRAMTVVLEASLEVRSAIVFASLVVLLVFLPILALDGVAGEFFRPLAFAYGLAVLASTAVALTITPVLALLLLPRGVRRPRRSPLARVLASAYRPTLTRVITRPWTAIVVVALLLGLAFVTASGLRQQFLPAFAENDVLMHWIARPGTSLTAVRRSADLVRQELMTVPGVRNFGAHLGRAEVADEVVGPNFAELWISVDPDVDLPRTLARVREVIDGYPGLYRDVQTYLQERMREVLSGGSGAVVVRLFGPDLAAQRERAGVLARRIEAIAGVVHARPESQELVPQIEVTPRLDRCAALAVDPGLVRAQASLLVQGQRVGQVLRGQQPIDVVIWGVEPLRQDLAAIRDLALTVTPGRTIRLADVADVRIAPTPNVIVHEAGSRKIDVVIDLAPDADLGAVAARIDAEVAALALPPGHHAEVLGEAEARTRASARLGLFAGLSVLGIGLVLLADFRSPRLTVLVLATLPFSLVGGVVAAVLAGGIISLGTLVGMVTVLGIAARNGIMMVAHFRHLEDREGVPFGPDLVVRGALERLAPVTMTGLATGLALVPLVVGGNTPGHEIENPMAVVILGGLVSSTLLSLLVLPALYLRFGRRVPGKASRQGRAR